MNHREMRTRFVTMAVVACLLCCATATAKKPPKPPPEPTPAELNPAIAFVAIEEGGREDTRQDVVVAAADLASEIVLTKTIQSKRRGYYTHTFGNPAWSADGSMVAFGATDWTDQDLVRKKLYVVNADGSELRLVRDFTSRPTISRPAAGTTLNWSTSGLELIYGSMAEPLVAIDVVTGDIRVLLDHPDDEFGQPALSPDMSDAAGYQGMIAMRGRDGSVDADGTPQFDIFVAPIDSDADGYLLPVDPVSIVNVTNAPGTNEFHPSWSPDGLALACFHDDGVDEWLAVIDMPTGDLLPVYPDYATQVSGGDRATWTSDGQYLIYRTDYSGIDRFDLTIIVADGSGLPANYTDTPNRRELWPAWNPQWDPAGPGAM